MKTGGRLIKHTPLLLLLLAESRLTRRLFADRALLSPGEIARGGDFQIDCKQMVA